MNKLKLLLIMPVFLHSCTNLNSNSTTTNNIEDKKSDKFYFTESKVKSVANGEKISLFKKDGINISAILHKPDKKSFNTKNNTLEFYKNPQGFSCKIFSIETTGAYTGDKDYDEFCRPVITVYSNNEFIARFPLRISRNNETFYYEVYAPCDEACTKPLNIKVEKTPGQVCKNGEMVGDRHIFEKDIEKSEFQYVNCNNPDRPPLKQYFEKEVVSLLNNAEPRLDVIEREIDALILQTETEYPEGGKFADTLKGAN